MLLSEVFEYTVKTVALGHFIEKLFGLNLWSSGQVTFLKEFINVLSLRGIRDSQIKKIK